MTDGFVYFMLLLDDDHPDAEVAYIKIGFTESPEVRVSNLRTAIPFDIQIEEIFPGSEADEKDIHKRLSAHRVKREWFRFNDAVDDFLDDLRDARVLLKMQHGEDYNPTIRECLKFENPREKLENIFGLATPEMVEAMCPPSPTPGR